MDAISKIDLFNKQLEYKSNRVGQGFNTQPKVEDELVVTILGEIVEATGFDGDDLFIQWEFKLPDFWQLDNSELLDFDEDEYANIELDEWNRIKSITHSASSTMQINENGDQTSVAHFCFPFDLQLNVLEAYANLRFPIMLIQVNSLDSWERNRVEGYGIVEIPHQPGFHELTIRTFKPDDDLYTRIMQFYLGGTIKVKDFSSLSNTLFKNNMDVGTVLNRFNQFTESSGDVKIRVNIAMQRDSLRTQKIAEKEEIEHRSKLEKLKEQKKKQMSNVTELTNFPTTLIKTQTGFVNRFNNSELPFK